MIRILAITNRDTTGAMLDNVLQPLGVSVQYAREPEQALATMRSTPLNGILINMPTFMRMQGAGKQALTDAITFFPVLRLRVDKEDGRITAFDSSGADGASLVTRFIQNECTGFFPRTIRKHDRFRQPCCILLSSGSGFSPRETERTVTINLSPAGAFAFSTYAWKPGGRAWIQFLDLSDKTPIPAQVIHSTRWGKGCLMPGCGLEFASLTGSQRTELHTMLGVPLPD